MFKSIKLILLIIIYTAFHFQSKAQDSLSKAKGIDSTIWFYSAKQGLSSKTYLGRADKTPLKHSEVKRMLLSYEPSAKEYKKFQRSNIGIFVSAPIAITALLIFKNQYNQNNTGNYTGLLFIGLGGLTMEIISAVNSMKHFNRALRLYNSHYKL